MYFCPKCNYSFDISKSFGLDNSEEKKMLKKVSEAIKVYEASDNLNNYRAEFKVEELEKNIKFKKLIEIEKLKFNILFQITNITNAQFKCNNCDFTKAIDETVLLYQYEVDNQIDKIRNLEDNKLMCSNPILPRTHDYYCKNESCPTNKKKVKKESVFFREKSSFKVNYICCLCYHSW
jgi:glutamate mutase epsilon subunit